MAGGKGYTFAAENEEDLNEWINVFSATLKKDQDNQENNQPEDSSGNNQCKFAM